MPLLSIIIPVYNVEKYLRECLDSVICPELNNYEIVCVNDGSTDSSPAILEEYSRRYPDRIHVITTENMGPGAASNTGIRKASGDYIVFLDSDDYYRENAVAEILETCREPSDICIFDFANVNNKGELIGVTEGCHREEGLFTLESYPQLLFEYPSRANKIFRRSLFSDHQLYYPPRVWFEDYRTTPKLYPYCSSIRYLHKVWYNYRQQPSSITHGSNTARNLEIIDAAEDLLAYFRQAGLYEKYRDELEYSLYYNVVLTSIDRVNLIDPKSDVQDKLLSYYISVFPDYESNKYFRGMSRKHMLIHSLIVHRHYGALHQILKLNNKVRGK